MRRGWVALLGFGSVLAAGCSTVRHHHPGGVVGPHASGAVQEGIASWYGPGFHGRRTSSREPYDQYDFTAAHRTLPLGTWALVTNTSNGHTVKVYINDRGPYVDGRVIDLSYGAARALGMIEEGTVPVHIVILGTEPPSEPRSVLVGDR
jgi:rare lipoprotein A